MRYAKELSESLCGVKAAGGGKLPESAKLLKEVSGGCDLMLKRAAELEQAVNAKSADKMLEGMVRLRTVADAMEGVVPHDRWPLPSYADMMFML
jgi:glutamine synthetase